MTLTLTPFIPLVSQLRLTRKPAQISNNHQRIAAPSSRSALALSSCCKSAYTFWVAFGSEVESWAHTDQGPAPHPNEPLCWLGQPQSERLNGGSASISPPLATELVVPTANRQAPRRSRAASRRGYYRALTGSNLGAGSGSGGWALRMRKDAPPCPAHTCLAHVLLLLAVIQNSVSVEIL